MMMIHMTMQLGIQMTLPLVNPQAHGPRACYDLVKLGISNHRVNFCAVHTGGGTTPAVPLNVHTAMHHWHASLQL